MVIRVELTLAATTVILISKDDSMPETSETLDRQSDRHMGASLAVFWWLDRSFFVRKRVFGRTFRPSPTLPASMVGRISDGQRAKASKTHLQFCGLRWHAPILVDHKQINNSFE